MKLKRFALRGLVILAVVVAACMYFARTVQTITTPKVRLITATTGRFEEKLSFQGEVYFPETEEVTVKEAAETPVKVLKLSVKPGAWVNAGDVLFTCEIPDQSEALEKLQKDYDAKSQELLNLDVENRKLSRSSEQNNLYDTMVASQKKLATLMAQARTIAVKNGVTLSGEVANWERQLNAQRNVPEEVRRAVNFTIAAQEKLAADQEAYFAILEDRKRKVSTETFEYINKRNTIISEMDELTEQIVEMNLSAEKMQAVTAAHDGFLISFNVAEGDTYDGSKVAYTITKEESLPVLRAPLGTVTRVIADGTRADLTLDQNGSEKSAVERTQVTADGSKYLIITLPEKYTAAGNTKLRQLLASGSVSVAITYRAKDSSTLITPSAVRSEGENSNYVYVVQTSRGDGFMNESTMTVVKTTVTVLERGDKVVSIAEDLSYQKIADREDRALTDGQTVMEYVN